MTGASNSNQPWMDGANTREGMAMRTLQIILVTLAIIFSGLAIYLSQDDRGKTTLIRDSRAIVIDPDTGILKSVGPNEVRIGCLMKK